MGIQPKRGTGHSIRPLLQRDIETAQANTLSGAEAARYLNVNYDTYRKYAKMYGLFDRHVNTPGVGIARPRIKGTMGLDEILSGKYPMYNRTKLKDRLIAAGKLPNACALCDFDEQRYLDGKVPLVLHYKDLNHLNLTLENLELRCYNCTYLTSGRISVKHLVTGAEYTRDAELSDDEIEQMQNDLMEQD
jgi:hypothetical protein